MLIGDYIIITNYIVRKITRAEMRLQHEINNNFKRNEY